jgi:peptide-methionine (S)-S-oxide reductase
MTEKTGNRKIIGEGGRLYLLALLAIVFTAAPILTTQAAGSTQCPIPQKGGNTMKQSKPNAALPRGVRPPIDLIAPAGTETATFALGWFWGADARFGLVKGVIRTQVGYTGGTKKDPKYTNLGDHSESIRIEYDPTRVSYEALLDIFWENHSPGERSFSRQYAPFIFYHSEEQKKSAMASREKTAVRIKGYVYTEIVPVSIFYPAEAYHQKYGLRSEKELMREFRSFYPSDSQFTASTAAARVNGYVSGEGTTEELEAELGSLGLSEAGRQKLRKIVESN